jgi:hypothetical protein
MSGAPEGGAIANTETRDQQVLELRGRGTSFGNIAKSLGFDRATEVIEAFNRALRRHGPVEQAELRRQELGRLDALASGVRANDGLAKDEVDRRLHTVEQLRARLLVD